MKGGITYPSKAGLDESHSGPLQRSSSVAQDAVNGATSAGQRPCLWASRGVLLGQAEEPKAGGKCCRKPQETLILPWPLLVFGLSGVMAAGPGVSALAGGREFLLPRRRVCVCDTARAICSFSTLYFGTILGIFASTEAI